MTTDHGYRDLSKPFNDCNLYGRPDAGGQTLPPVTRVIPDCGHTYFIRGHVPRDSPLVTPLCRGCQSLQPLKEAQRNWEETKYTLERPDIRG